MKRSLLLLPVLALAAAGTAAQDLQGPSWTPVGFHVSKPDPGKNAFQANEGGTRVVARLKVPGRSIVNVDVAKSKLDSFTDDKNTDLLGAAAAAAAKGGFPRTRPITADGTPSRSTPGEVTFTAPGLPVRGASKVRVKGSIVVVVGKGEKDFEKKDVSLKTGGEFDFGTLKTLPRSGFGVDKGAAFEANITRFTIEGDKPILSVTLIDADGKEITGRVSAFSSSRAMPAGAGPLYRTNYSVSTKAPDKVTLKVKYFNAVEELTVPIDLEVGPGF